MSLPGMTKHEMNEQEFTMPEMLMRPWLRVGDRAMLHAAPGLGKSWLAMAIAMVVAGGGQLMDWSVDKPKRVLFIDAEMTYGELKMRQAALLRTLGGVDEAALDENLRTVSKLDFDADDGLRAWPTPTSDADRIYGWAIGHGAGLVVLDNLCGLTEVRDENSGPEWRPLLDLIGRLKAAGCAVLMIHHDGKDKRDYRGSAELDRPLEVRLHMQAKPGRRPGEAAFKLVYRKDRHGLNQDQSVGIELQGAMDALRWVVDNDPVLDTSWRVSEQDECRNLMALAQADDYPTKAALAGEAGVSRPTLDKRIRAAVRLGMVESSEAFVYLMKETPAVASAVSDV